MFAITVSIARVAGDQHRDLSIVEPLHGPAYLECDPDPGSAPHAHHDEVAGVLLGHRRQRGDGDVQVVGVDHVEHRSADELLVGPTEHADRPLVGVAQGPVRIDGDHGIGEAVERGFGDCEVRTAHEGVSAPPHLTVSRVVAILTKS